MVRKVLRGFFVKIAKPFKAYSHTPGHKALLPGTSWYTRVYPAAFDLGCLDNREPLSFFWNIKGPVSPFTVEQEFMSSCVRVYGDSPNGYFRFRLSAEEDSIFLVVEKTPVEGLSLFTEEGTFLKNLLQGDRLSLVSGVSLSLNKDKEELFLGNNKKRDWDQIRKRKDLSEILPLWHFLGQDYSDSLEAQEGPVVDLLKQVEKKIEVKDRSVFDAFLAIYLAGFSAGLVPRACDEEKQGIVPLFPCLGEQKIPSFLGRGASLIRFLFFKEKEDSFFVLPCLPTPCVFGKLLNLKTKNGCKVDLEWSKREMRNMRISSQNAKTLKLHFPSEVKEYRVRTSLKDKGYFIEKDEPLDINAGQTLFLDRFQK